MNINNDFHEISETLKSAKLYVDNLNYLKKEIRDVEKQVLTTFQETQANIKETFSNLKDKMCKLLENRERDLLKRAEEIKIDGLQPLKQCETVIETNIKNTQSLIDEGSQVVQNELVRINQFLEKANILGNLPEVPSSKEVPFISFYHEPNAWDELENIISCFGEVFRIAPVQIKNVTPKPGALLIEWEQSYENSEDRIKEIQEFKLQRAFGDVVKQKNLAVNFIDCYTGPDTQFLLRDIQISQPYSFRVSCKFDGTTEWSPWSVPHVGSTSIRWFSWKKIEGVALSNEDKIVSLQDEVGDIGKVVFSHEAQVSLTDSVEFTILEADPKSEIILALTTEQGCGLKNIKDIGEVAFMVNSSGVTTIGGTLKSTILSRFVRGLKVCFSLEPVKPNKVRVNVDCRDKRVTYDWSIGECSHLFFACQIMPRWKIMVE